MRRLCVLRGKNFISVLSRGSMPSKDIPIKIIKREVPAELLNALFKNLHKQPIIIFRNKWMAALIMSIVLCNAANATVIGPGSAWSFCRKITLSAATPTANFQVKVSLITGQYSNMNVAGNDLRFYDINNNVCSYWIESWNNAATSVVWVNVVTLRLHLFICTTVTLLHLRQATEQPLLIFLMILPHHLALPGQPMPAVVR